jgi:hypothetical protein
MSLKPYTILKGKHEGETAFVVGAGTSLLECLKTPRWDEIHDHVVVSINSSFIEMAWGSGDPDRRYWISNDALCRWWDYFQQVKKAKANRIVRNSWEKYYKEIPDFLYFWPRPTSEGICKPEDEGLAYCSSVPTGIDLCIQMGVKRIFLLGVDQYQKDGKSHFWQFYRPGEQPRRIDRRLASWGEQTNAFNYNDIAYPALKKLADVKGVEVFNCNPESRVDAFDKITFEQALDRIKQ